MTDLLKGVVNSGTGTRVRSYFTGTCAGKTGQRTTSLMHGLSVHSSTGCRLWVGFDDARIRLLARMSGSRAGRQYLDCSCRRRMKILISDSHRRYLFQPEGIITDTICADTKKKAREWCPNKMTEIFNAKYPIGLCDKHTSADWNQGKEDEDTRKKSKINW